MNCKATINLICLFYLQVGVHFIEGKSGTVLLTNVIYLNGDRNPIHLLPSEPSTDTDWPEGLGELTMLGKQQAYQLGLSLRHSYADFISNSYSMKEIYVRSIDTRSSLMTAQVVLSAIYPPSGEQVWNNSIPWQPIPVHTAPAELDQLFSKASCEKLTQLEKEAISQDKVQYVNETYGELLKSIHKGAGFTNWKLSSTDLFGHFPDVYENVFAMNRKQMTLPTWVDESILGRLTDQVYPLYLYIDAQNTDVQRLRAGSLLDKWLADVENKTTNDMNGLKMLMYSGDQTTLLSLLHLFVPTENFSLPGDSSMLRLELYKHADEGTEVQKRHAENDDVPVTEKPDVVSQDSAFFVRLWYGNAKEQRQLNITGCESDCDLTTLLKLVEKSRVRDREKECRVYWIFGYATYENAFLAAVAGSGLACVLLVILLFCCCCALFRRCGCRSYRCCRRHSAAQSTRKYRVYEQAAQEQVPMITTNFSDED